SAMNRNSSMMLGAETRLHWSGACREGARKDRSAPPDGLLEQRHSPAGTVRNQFLFKGMASNAEPLGDRIGLPVELLLSSQIRRGTFRQSPAAGGLARSHEGFAALQQTVSH